MVSSAGPKGGQSNKRKTRAPHTLNGRRRRKEIKGWAWRGRGGEPTATRDGRKTADAQTWLRFATSCYADSAVYSSLRREEEQLVDLSTDLDEVYATRA